MYTNYFVYYVAADRLARLNGLKELTSGMKIPREEFNLRQLILGAILF